MSDKKNKLILFDWGNIVESHLIGYKNKDAWNDLFKELGYKGAQEVASSLSKYQLSAIASMEQLEDTFYQMQKDFGLMGDFQHFVEKYRYFFDKIDSYQEVRDYEISLKNKCYIGILSNLTILDKKRLDRQVGLQHYDYVFLSYEMGCKKPSQAIYQQVQSQLPFEKADILFIDDKLENVNAAREWGWNAVQANGLEIEKIKAACEKFIEK